MTTTASLGLVLSLVIFGALVASVGGMLVSDFDLFSGWGSQTSVADMQETALLVNAGIESMASKKAIGGLALASRKSNQGKTVNGAVGTTTALRSETEASATERTFYAKNPILSIVLGYSASNDLRSSVNLSE